MRSSVLALAVSVVWLAGCTVEPLDLSGRSCPCVDGWVCDEATDRCVPEGEFDAGGERDGGPFDAGDTDAGDTDADPFDAGPPDAADGGGADAGLLSDAGPDAGPGDSGPPDSGPPDAGPVDAGPCNGLGYWCDDFESADFSAWTGQTGAAPATAAVESGRVHSGSYAAHFFADGDAIESTVYAEVVPIPNPPDIYYRAWYYTPDTFIEYHALFNEVTGYIVVFTNGSDEYDVHSHDYVSDFRAPVAEGFPRNQWVCVEMHIQPGQVAGLVELFVDDVRQVSLTTDTTTPRGLLTATTGITFRQVGADSPRSLWVDDVVVSTHRIGCTGAF